MNHPKFNLFFLFLTLNVLLSCGDNKGKNISSETVNSNQGILNDTLNLIYNGPKNFRLDYFPKTTIQEARVRECEIIQNDSTSSRVARKIQFDSNGNITNDENNFFFYSFKGVVRGTYSYQYNAGKLIKMKGIPEENSKDSVMTEWNYNTKGFLHSRDAYQFAKKLKPGADRHLPAPSDFEKYPTWNKQESLLFSINLDTVTIETIFENETVNIEKYQILFDNSKRLKEVKKFRKSSLVETTIYTYKPNSIVGFIKRTMNDGTEWTYNSKVIFNQKGQFAEKLIFNDNGTEKVKMIVSYNHNNTIRSIKNGSTIQEFKYNFY